MKQKWGQLVAGFCANTTTNKVFFCENFSYTQRVLWVFARMTREQRKSNLWLQHNILSSNITRNIYCSRSRILFRRNEVAKEPFLRSWVIRSLNENNQISWRHEQMNQSETAIVLLVKQQFKKLLIKRTSSYLAIKHVSITMVSLAFTIFIAFHVTCSFSEPRRVSKLINSLVYFN